MKEIYSPKSFVFNDNIESSYLNSLYEEDYQYIEKIFFMTYTQLEAEIPQLEAVFREGSVTGLQQRIHRIKPSFGFVGMLRMEEICRIWEEKCRNVSDMQVLSEAAPEFLRELNRGKELIQTEYNRLMDFNHKAA